ncbi:MAG: HD domain-containing protein [Lachnospiraceae bacterium]|nr:HD domain-containing protein [Lachnospiraceae bacterium]
MTFYDFGNIVSLICIIAGLLYCFFKYVDKPTRGYRYIIGFFLAMFLSEYYWTVYVLVIGQDPGVSDFVSYLGWNVAIVFLLVSACIMRSKESKRYFHPLILLPVIINIPQFYLYITFEGRIYVDAEGFVNNLWQVGITTVIAVVCMQELMYYLKVGKKEDRKFPWFSLIVILYLASKYAMWTASCYSWSSSLEDPYHYFNIICSVILLFFGAGAAAYYRPRDAKSSEKRTADLRPQLLLQTLLSVAIVGVCIVGFFITVMMRDSRLNENGALQDSGHIVLYLFLISAVVVFLVLMLLFLLTSRYRRMMENRKQTNEGLMGRINFIITIVVTLALMGFAVVYNIVTLYNSSVISVYENGENAIKTTATDIENYLTLAEATLKVAADSVELMMTGGSTTEDIRRYLTDQTRIQSSQFDENFTGIYAYINGEYIDGAGWEPPEGYDPTTRDWYKTAVYADGEVVIVKPYVDAQTGSIVITVAKRITSAGGTSTDRAKNVVCLDVVFNHLQDVAEETEVLGKGSGMVIANDGFIIAHKDESYDGGNVGDYYGREFLRSIRSVKSGRFETTVTYEEWKKINNEKVTVFVRPVMDQWYTVITVTNRELFERTYSQLAVTIMVSLITFCLISIFYYIGYKNEQVYGEKVEEMNIQVVSALASAIDAKDTYTNGHSSRVAEYSRMIAERAGYSKARQDEIYMMGLLHDVGKIGVPDEVINKPAKLTDEEFEYIKKHPVIGAGILERIKERPTLAVGARWHHERYGGGGYPDGISGEDIPEEARIIAVADAYDAMTSRRSYRDVMPQSRVREEIQKGSGTQFDPKFADVMLKMIDEDTDYTMHETDDGEK